ncbi:MAG: protein kinase [Terracidiphilus sp.]|jgi:tetratricopeptide (TPR) repeat protein/predicted Ser/Thr protein kinase
MEHERWRKVETIFNRVIDADKSHRESLLKELCSGDEDLYREVESRLARVAASGGPLDQPTAAFPADAPTLDLSPGALLGPYQIQCLIGQGGMGKVYRALDTRLGRTVAIKTSSANFIQRSAREARAIAALNHPHICQLFDLGPDYLVMEYIEGTPLKGPLPLEQTLQYADQICDALEAAHRKGIVHRDLKPGNILLSNSGIKLLDFGLAQIKTGPEDRTLANLTISGAVVGTPGYMAPEQWKGIRADERSDIYSFGCLLYELLTGRHAGPLMAMSNLGHEASPELRRILVKCLQDDPDQRYQHVAEIRADLQRLRQTSASAPVGIHAGSGVQGIIARHWKLIVPAAALLIVAAVAGYFSHRLHAAPKLTAKDTIVLADFENKTGDPVFDGTLRQGLAIQLEQSPFLRTVDDVQLQRDLRLMGVPPGSLISIPLAHDICVRDGAAATIDPSIVSLGKSYVLTLQAITCQNGVTLAREQVTAYDKEHVLSALGNAATALRGKLGESLSTIQKLNRPLEQVTTGSLDALQNYTAALDELSRGRYLAAIPMFKRALALDPNFAMAYYHLGVAWYNAGDRQRGDECARKAFSLIDRVSDYERYLISDGYYQSTGEYYKDLDVLRLGIADYPRSWGLHNLLSTQLMDLGQFEEALREGQAAAELQPNVEPPYRRLLDAYMCLDRLDEAKKAAGKARMLGIDGARIHQRFLELAYIDGDQVAAAREIQWFAGRAEEYLSFGLQAANLNLLGRRRESSKLYQRAAETAKRQGLQSVAAGFEEADARADALLGNCLTAHHLERPALALALCGETAKAEKFVTENSKLFPNGTLWNSVQLPEVAAASELQRGDPARAVEMLASATPYERAYPETVYLRGLAYLRLQKSNEAAVEFRKIVDHKGASWGSTWVSPNWGQYYSLACLGLARATALTGDTAKAKAAYLDFLTLWKDADHDISILNQARAEYAKLR